MKRLLQDGQPFEDAGLTVSVRPLGTLSSALNGDAPFYEEVPSTDCLAMMRHLNTDDEHSHRNMWRTLFVGHCM